MKEAAATSAGRPLDAAFATRYVWEARRMRSEDAVEGPLALVAKREPRWRGR